LTVQTSPNTQAILLLTTHFVGGKSAAATGGAARPLTPKEWGRFAEWLKSRQLAPGDLLRGDLAALLEDWRDKTISIARIEALLARGVALSLAMERWLSAGLWVMTRADADYPARLKQRLGVDSPAVLFGGGRRALLGGGGVAVVGSRNANARDIDYSRALGERASQAGRTVVSGGARGVDEAAMLGALEADGTAVGVLACELLRACTGEKYRRHLTAGNLANLALVSPFNPEAPFNAGHAMQRNKYIYCLADLGVVVRAGTTGGTWKGATEALRNNWVELSATVTHDAHTGNAALIRLGAREIPADIRRLDINRLFESTAEPGNESPPPARELFDHAAPVATPKDSATQSDTGARAKSA